MKTLPEMYDELAAENERLRAERETFYETYRRKCDEETKAQAVEIERLRAVLRSFTELYHNYSDERVCCGSRYKQPHAADCEVMAVLGEQ